MSHGGAEFTERLAVPLEKDWADFPEALPIIIAAAKGDESAHWGLHLFFGDDGALIGTNICPPGVRQVCLLSDRDEWIRPGAGSAVAAQPVFN